MPRARSSASSTAPAPSPTRPGSTTAERRSSPRRPAPVTARPVRCHRRRAARAGAGVVDVPRSRRPRTRRRAGDATSRVPPRSGARRTRPGLRRAPARGRREAHPALRRAPLAPLGRGLPHRRRARRASPSPARRRTADQQRHDVLAAVIDTAARSGEHPTIGGAAPTVLVSVRASDLAAGRGVAHADGVELPISLRAARHMICTGGIQTVVFDDARPHHRARLARTLLHPAPASGDHPPRRRMPHPRLLRARRLVRDPPRHPRRRRAARPTPTTACSSAGSTTARSTPPAGGSGCSAACPTSAHPPGSTPAAAGGPSRNPRPDSPTSATGGRSNRNGAGGNPSPARWSRRRDPGPGPAAGQIHPRERADPRTTRNPSGRPDRAPRRRRVGQPRLHVGPGAPGRQVPQQSRERVVAGGPRDDPRGRLGREHAEPPVLPRDREHLGVQHHVVVGHGSWRAVRPPRSRGRSRARARRRWTGRRRTRPTPRRRAPSGSRSCTTYGAPAVADQRATSSSDAPSNARRAHVGESLERVDGRRRLVTDDDQCGAGRCLHFRILRPSAASGGCPASSNAPAHAIRSTTLPVLCPVST